MCRSVSAISHENDQSFAPGTYLRRFQIRNDWTAPYNIGYLGTISASLDVKSRGCPMYFNDPVLEHKVCFIPPLMRLSAVRVPSTSFMTLHGIDRLYLGRCCLVARS